MDYPWRRSSRDRRGARDLEISAVPARSHHRAPLRGDAVLEGEGRSRALQQGLGDEHAEPQAAAGLAADVEAAPARRRDVGLADPVHDLGREARAIIADRYADLLGAIAHRHFDPLAREVDRVLHQVAETIEDARIAT